MLVKGFLFVWLVLAALAAAKVLFNALGVWGLVLIAGIVIVGLYVWMKTQRRRKRDGYHVFRRGGAEDGIVYYNENGQSLQLYFNRIADTIYIPSEAKWKEVMPDWAHDRRQQIIERVKEGIGKRLIGKSSIYEETDNTSHIVPKELQEAR
jgi:hypothetical protein